MFKGVKEMWEDYIKSGLEFRIDLMKLNDLYNKLN